MTRMQMYMKELRPEDWLKNVFVWVPVVFSLQLFSRVSVLATGIAFIAFCLVSSAVYTFNDICDAQKDAMHPTKCKRPIASGAISRKNAGILCVVLVISGCVLSYIVDYRVFLIVITYLIINLVYTLVLKHVAVFDCFCIAAGFVLRTFAGGYACGEYVSDWLFLTIVSMSLFMAFGKRRAEMLDIDEDSQRVVLQSYNLTFLNNTVFVCAGLAIVFYSLWAMNVGTNVLYTVPLVIFIVLKYLLVITGSANNSSGNPTDVVLTNKTLLGAGAALGIILILLLYAGS